MGGFPNESLFSKLKEHFAAFRREMIEGSVRHPFRSSTPLLGATALLLSGVILATSCTFCYRVEGQDGTLAYFHGEDTYQAAVTKAEERASAILNTSYSLDQTDLSVRATFAPRSAIEALPGVTNSILETIPELEHIYTLSVDGVVVGAAADDDIINAALDQIKATYTTPDTLSLRFDSQVSVRYEYLPAGTQVVSTEELVELLTATAPRTFDYVVQPGDTVESVMETFSMTQERLQELNPDLDLTLQPFLGYSGTESEADGQVTAAELRDTPIQPDGQPAMVSAAKAASPAAQSGETQTDEAGETDQPADYPETKTPLETGLTLTIEQECPRLVVTTIEETTGSQEIIPQVEAQPDDTMFQGEERIIEEGVAGEKSVLSRVEKRCGLEVASAELSSMTITEATPLVVGTGTRERPQLPDGCLFQWPVRGPITSDFGHRYIFGENNFHRGVDIAAPMGTAINAGADGTVVFAGPKGTYGNLVVLAHSNGFYTYYGHCSKILVTPGQTVTMGQPIAAVGSTGRSTGPHCHFEVRYQNNPIDPLLYLPGANNAPYRTIDISDVQEEEEEKDEEKKEETKKEETTPSVTTPEVVTPVTPEPSPEPEPAEPEPEPEPTPEPEPVQDPGEAVSQAVDAVTSPTIGQTASPNPDTNQ